MRGTRRSLLLSAAVGLGTGCVPNQYRAEYPVSPVANRVNPTPPAAAGPGVAAPPMELLAGRGPLPENTPPSAPTDTPLPINLATALQLSNARPLDVQIAGRQVAVA